MIEKRTCIPLCLQYLPRGPGGILGEKGQASQLHVCCVSACTHTHPCHSPFFVCLAALIRGSGPALSPDLSHGTTQLFHLVKLVAQAPQQINEKPLLSPTLPPAGKQLKDSGC